MCKPEAAYYQRRTTITHLTSHQRTVLRALREFGKPLDDERLAIYVHHVTNEPLSSSSVRSRRAELVRKGLVQVVGTKKLKSGRRAAVHSITPAGRQALRTRAKAAV